jgi:hypothetical protein
LGYTSGLIVNGTLYNLERVGEKVYVNDKEVMVMLNEDSYTKKV